MWRKLVVCLFIFSFYNVLFSFQKNYIFNYSFEELIFSEKGEEWPVDWKIYTSIQHKKQKFRIINNIQQAFNGNCCLASINQRGGFMSIRTIVKIKSNKKYKFKISVKGEKKAKIRLMLKIKYTADKKRNTNLSKKNNMNASKVISVSSTWKEHTGVLLFKKNDRNVDRVYFVIYIWAPRSSEPVYLDDVCLFSTR